MTLLGGDSASPKPTQYQGHKIWGVYVAGATFHIWSHAEVAELSRYGIEGVMPIVVPPQNEAWWMDNYGYATLESLVRQAKAWGVPELSPLCLDIEQHQADQMADPGNIAHAWAVATRAHKYRTWTYSGRSYLANDRYGFKWLAEWPEPTPSHPQLPQGFNAWQYATRPAEGIDLDIFEGGRDYMTPHREVFVLPRSEAASSASDSTEGTDPVTVPAGERADTQPAPAGDLVKEHL
jgi:hypothetical protein